MVFRIHMCTYYKIKKEGIMCAPHCGGSRRGKGGGTSRGCYVAVELAGWLVGLH